MNVAVGAATTAVDSKASAAAEAGDGPSPTSTTASLTPAMSMTQTQPEDYEAEAEEVEDDDDEDEDDLELLGTVSTNTAHNCQIVGIRYYTGKAHPGEYVRLAREPSNPYDRNAIR
jgi:SWI/SNF-related matrix-associated actin-dependent regulator of chromatin subfamily A3